MFEVKTGKQVAAIAFEDKLKQIEQLKSKISEFEKIQQAYNTLKIERDSLNDRIKQEINIKQQIT